MGSHAMADYEFNGRMVTVYGCFDEETEGGYDFYDLYYHERHLNEGDPWYDGEGSATSTKPPSAEEVLVYLVPTYGELFLEERIYRVVARIRVNDDRKAADLFGEDTDRRYILQLEDDESVAVSTVVMEPRHRGDAVGITFESMNPLGVMNAIAAARELKWSDWDRMVMMARYIYDIDPIGFQQFIMRMADRSDLSTNERSLIDALDTRRAAM